MDSSIKRLSFSRYKGFAMALSGAALWGLSGTVAQILFQNEGIQPGWLVTIRLLVSGLLLLVFGLTQKNGHQVWSIWKNPKDLIPLIIFGLLGMLGVQYTYFAAINVGNAATATLLQFLGPVFITIYLALRFGRMPSIKELLAVSLALLGTFLLVTNGSFHELSISGLAVAWGLASAITAAFYTLFPAGLLKRWNSVVVVGWGMLIGGFGLSLINPPWHVDSQNWSIHTGLFIGFVIIFGTLIPFYLFLDSLRYIKPTEASLLSSAEPLSAAFASVVWLRVPFGLYEGIGGLCIIATVAMLSFNSKSEHTPSIEETVEGCREAG